MVIDFLRGAGGKRYGTAYRQAEAFRRRTFREKECTFGERTGRVSAVMLRGVDDAGIEIRPEILEWFRQPAPDQLDIALASGPVSAEEAAHCRRFICILQYKQRFQLLGRKEALRNAQDPARIPGDLLKIDPDRVIRNPADGDPVRMGDVIVKIGISRKTGFLPGNAKLTGQFFR